MCKAVNLMPDIILDQDKCIDCKICIMTCPMGVFKEGDMIMVSAPEECIVCMGCVPACPTEAITVIE